MSALARFTFISAANSLISGSGVLRTPSMLPIGALPAQCNGPGSAFADSRCGGGLKLFADAS